jgi:hypothetical protein
MKKEKNKLIKVLTWWGKILDSRRRFGGKMTKQKNL